jgi:hypothetical protein
VRSLPPPRRPEPPPLDLGEGFPEIARQAIEAGEQALVDLRTNTVQRWYLVGGACFMLRNVAVNRSGANSPAVARYNRVYATLAHAWPELAKLHKGVRSDAIWLYENSESVLPWLATQVQSQRDAWTHPSVIRRHYEKRHPYDMLDKPSAYRPRPLRHKRQWNKQPLGERSREDLEMLIGELGEQLADREREIAEKDALLDAKDREIAQLRNDLAWERMERRQLEASAMVPGTTVVRSDGSPAEIVHAVTRASQEIVPPESHGHPDYAAWAKLVTARMVFLSALELHWLIADNRAHFDAYERAYPGAGVGLEDHINARIAELEQAAIAQ